MESTASNLPQGEVVKSINRAQLFAGIGLEELKLLAEKSVIEQYHEGDIVIEQGEIGDKLYIIMHGQMLVSVKDINLGRKRINILGDGDVFGEIAILRRVPRTARVTALTHCTLLTINADDFYNVYRYFPARARDNIQLVVAKRLQELSYHTH